MKILKPQENVFAFYEGRDDGLRFAETDNWVDEGALSLGIASYAIADAGHALVYDTHVSLDHARRIRTFLESQGIDKFTIVLSHWHLDHVAGTGVFADCEIIANQRTAQHLTEKRAAIEAGALEGPPAISPLLLPTKTFAGQTRLRIGSIDVDLIEANIHSDDATVLWLPERRLLFAGDTMEDTVTYVGEPEMLDRHLADLDRLWALDPERILPNHGDAEAIAAGGYEKSLIRATQQYIRALQRMAASPELRALPMTEIIAGPLKAGWINYFAPYEAVHRSNVEMVVAAAKR